jgi:hypothetical protein
MYNEKDGKCIGLHKRRLRGLDVGGDNTNGTIRKIVRGLEMYEAG